MVLERLIGYEFIDFEDLFDVVEECVGDDVISYSNVERLPNDSMELNEVCLCTDSKHLDVIIEFDRNTNEIIDAYIND